MTDQDAPRGPEGHLPQDETPDRGLTDILNALGDDDAPASDGELAAVDASTPGGDSAESVATAPAPIDESAPAKRTWRLFGKRPEAVEDQAAMLEDLGAAERPTVMFDAVGQSPAVERPSGSTLEGQECVDGEWLAASGGDSGADEPLWATGAFGAVGPTQDDATSVIPALVEIPRDVDMGPAKRGRWWVWALAAVAVFAVLGVAGYAWWWTTSRPIITPDVVGKKPAEATQTFNDVGLRLGKVSEIPTDSAPVGTIISQNPEAGTRLKPDQELSFVVAASPEQTKVPSVVGVSAEQAAEALAQARLRTVEVESFNSTVAAGFVVAQLPDQGLELAPGTAVAVVVSKGPAPTTATVPRLTGMHEADAVTLLEAVGLRARIYSSPDASITVDTVKDQLPLHGTAATQGSVVQVLVSQGSATTSVTVPTVTGQTRKEAAAAIKARGLVAEVVVVSNATVAKGRVISQMPLAGGRSAAKGTVGLLVSAGNASEGPVPSVVGTASAEASAVISAARFAPVFVSIGIEGYTADTVFAQYPQPGTTHPFRFPMVCLVAKAPGL